MPRRILIAEHDQGSRIELYGSLTAHGYEVILAEEGRRAESILQDTPCDLVLVNLDLPGIDGLDLLQRMRDRGNRIPAVILCDDGAADVESAVEALRFGVLDFVVKPVSGDIAQAIAGRAFAASSDVVPQKYVSSLSQDEDHGTLQEKRPVVGEDPQFLRLLERARTVASSKATVLILGESGTGKEVFARYIHNHSNRNKGPFVALNCAALPDGLLESELFGHEKGAFTGAVISKKGKFELAGGGTLLLDEIGEIPLHLQAKLLRVLQEEEVDRLGGKAPCKVDVHVIATTNRRLDEAVQEGLFRQDLFYRLNVIPIRLPALRDRKNDIPLLVDYFIRKYSSQYGKQPKKLSSRSMSIFLEYDWPGNVREMENLIERGVLLSTGGMIEPHDFWDELDAPEIVSGLVAAADSSAEPALVVHGDTVDELPTLKDVERQMILHALQKTDNNRTHAARMLGVSVRTLRNKLHEYRDQGIID